MDRKDFVLHRVAFAGLPYGALRAVADKLDTPYGWRRSLLAQARALRRAARHAATHGRSTSAAQYFRWAGIAYHSATLGPDLNQLEDLGRINRLRRLAVAAYGQALPHDGRCRRVALPEGSDHVYGYCRLPGRDPRGLVLLLNGLDSLCEVEMHAFGDGLLERGLAVLALDLPARFTSPRRQPELEVERLWPALHGWLAEHGLAGCRRGVFGVSFGGYLVARLLAHTDAFAAGILVSPPAWVGDRQTAHPYFSRMFGWSFGTAAPERLRQLAAGVDLAALPAPRAPCRLYQMVDDGLFGAEHAAAYRRWGGRPLEAITVAAEHVGTSRFYQWLPAAYDWMVERLADD